MQTRGTVSNCSHVRCISESTEWILITPLPKKECKANVTSHFKITLIEI